ncbi:endo-alpha-N-acetylgalactosaminidase family protein [Echinicola shivajiensis]|uniref:endo-alpha-N-acetylgalactosaminidase family protein n=1 Tax=Echinicola shivajiensis TaxID=1035916 RepID=UPI001BFCAF8F|nr:endo-alpha-N-acetylgalactosaminidase family protein [Echinicola shivajiensis]
MSSETYIKGYKISLILGIFVLLIPLLALGQGDTLFNSFQKNPQIISWNHAYHQTLTLKLMLSQSKFDGKLKRRDNGDSEVFLDFEEALEVIKKIDHLTLGMPKIIYLVGWQYHGHDSKYPAWFEVNERLKRKVDKTALESLKWLMEAAKKYHTTVSVHINMFDAYEDSPLWQTYVENDIIAKEKDGSLREGEWGYPISYAQELKTGFAQKRIDSLCTLLPLKDAGTVHIDAFHTWAPIGEEGPGKHPFLMEPISPYLDFSVEDESNAQVELFKYWASKGVDVTSEGATFLRKNNFAGIQPMAWWVDWGLEDYLNWPASYYSGGVDRRDYGKLFGTSMHGEQLVKNDPENLLGFKEKFCTQTLIWYFLNQLERKYYVKEEGLQSVVFSNGVSTELENGELKLLQKEKVLVDGQDVFVPALWMSEKGIVAYSKEGYKERKWAIPKDWEGVGQLEVFEIGIEGKTRLSELPVQDGLLTLSMPKDQMLLIIPK